MICLFGNCLITHIIGTYLGPAAVGRICRFGWASPRVTDNVLVTTLSGEMNWISIVCRSLASGIAYDSKRE
jgi:hypothetical protein